MSEELKTDSQKLFEARLAADNAAHAAASLLPDSTACSAWGTAAKVTAEPVAGEDE